MLCPPCGKGEHLDWGEGEGRKWSQERMTWGEEVLGIWGPEGRVF